MLKRSAAALALILVGASCSDSVSPISFAGTYSLSNWKDKDWTPLTPVEYPFQPGATVTMDSLYDEITLSADGTYEEQGALWGHSILTSGDQEFPIEVNGTYVVNGKTITLTPPEGSPVLETTATFDPKTKTLVVIRYPGIWTFGR